MKKFPFRHIFVPILPLCLVLCLTVCLASCTDQEKRGGQRVREVAVFKLVPQQVSLTAELSGRVSAFRKAEVRPQVSGILQKQLFTEGTIVQQGQSLYKIDPDTYIAAVESARAARASAEAQLHAARLRFDRRRALLRSQAVSQQSYEDAHAEYLQARANVEVANAALRTAEIQLRYTDVQAPITGRIGKSNVTQGALVTANQADELAVIQQLDPVYVDMTQSSLAMLRLRDRYAAGKLTRPGAEHTEVHLRLETGNSYPLAGELKFADISVDESTGSVLLRSVFPNPNHVLLPGMYVRASINEGVEERALLVPQRAVRRDPKGNASVFVLGKNSTAEQRNVLATDHVGRFWLISDGLKEGELVIIDGLQGLRQGSPVKVRETLTPATYKQPQDGR